MCNRSTDSGHRNPQKTDGKIESTNFVVWALRAKLFQYFASPIKWKRFQYTFATVQIRDERSFWLVQVRNFKLQNAGTCASMTTRARASMISRPGNLFWIIKSNNGLRRQMVWIWWKIGVNMLRACLCLCPTPAQPEYFESDVRHFRQTDVIHILHSKHFHSN